MSILDWLRGKKTSSPSAQQPKQTYISSEEGESREKIHKIGNNAVSTSQADKCSMCGREIYSLSMSETERHIRSGQADMIMAIATLCPKCNAIYCAGCVHSTNRQCPKCWVDVEDLRNKPHAASPSPSELQPTHGDEPNVTKRNIAPANAFSPAVQMLHYAIVTGNYSQVKLLSELNPGNINANHEDGVGTALHRAAQLGDDTMVVELLAYGADPSVKNDKGHTPLHEAVIGTGGRFDRGGKPRIVDLLIAAGADVDARANDGRTPKDCAPPTLLGGEAVLIVLEALERANTNKA